MVRQWRSRIIAIGISCGFLGGCGLFSKPKDYCPALAAITLEMGNHTATVINIDGEDPEARPQLEELATLFAEKTEQIRELTPEETQLLIYQSQLAQIYQDYSNSTTMMMEARAKRDRDLALAAKALVLQAGEKEAALIPILTDYCQTPIEDRSP